MTLALRAASTSSHRLLASTSDDYTRRIGRISSGLRIVRAADDAAGLAIATKLRAQVAGSAVATRNVHDAINLLNVADGGMQGITDLLHRARELSVQAASTGSGTASDREAVAAEVGHLVAEIDRLAGATTHNEMRLLDGSRSAGFSFHVGAGPSDTLTVALGDMRATTLGLLGGSSGTLSLAETTYATESKKFTSYTASTSNNVFDVAVGADAAFRVTLDPAAGSLSGAQLQQELQRQLTAGGVAVTVGLESFNNGTSRLSFTAAAGTTTKVAVTGSGADDPVLRIATTETVSTSTASTSSGQSLVDLVSAGDGEAIALVDAALSTVMSARTGVGAAQSRLQHRLGVLAATEENLGAARSRIEDADLAVEMAGLVRARVLGEAGLALQAQQAPSAQRVLRLLDSL